MSVYFITARQVGLVKIGCAFNAVRRLNCLQTASPVELTLEALLPGAYEEERELHERFAFQRVRGEWFTIVPEMEGIIQANPAPDVKSAAKFLKTARKMQHKPRKPYDPSMDRDARRYAEAMAAMRAA